MQRFFIYVVELAPKDRLRRGKPEVYVGSSALAPEERFRKHKSRSPKSSRHVRRRGLRLLPHLYQHINPLSSREEAKHQEHVMRRRLEAHGYKVYGSCSPSATFECWL